MTYCDEETSALRDGTTAAKEGHKEHDAAHGQDQEHGNRVQVIPNDGRHEVAVYSKPDADPQKYAAA